MSCTSASVAPSGRHVASRLSTTPLRASIWSSQPGSAGAGSAVIGSVLQRHVEVPDVEVVVGPELRGAQAVLLGGVPVTAVGAHPVAVLPFEDVVLDRGFQSETEPLVDAPDGSFGIADQITVM